MTTSNYVQVPPNSSGLKIDTSEVVVGSNTVERQNIVIADPAQPGNLLGISSSGALSADVPDLLQWQILGQLKRIALLLEILTDNHVALEDVT